MHWYFVQINIGIDGREGMKLIFGIIVVEGKGNQGKVAKVNLKIYLGILFFDLFPFLPHPIKISNVTNFMMFSLFASSLAVYLGEYGSLSSLL